LADTGHFQRAAIRLQRTCARRKIGAGLHFVPPRQQAILGLSYLWSISQTSVSKVNCEIGGSVPFGTSMACDFARERDGERCGNRSSASADDAVFIRPRPWTRRGNPRGPPPSRTRFPA